MDLLLLTIVTSLVIQLVLFVPAFIFKTDKLTDLSYSITFALLAIILFFNSTKQTLHIVLLLMLLLWSIRLGAYLFIRINKTKVDKRFNGIRENFFKFLKFWILQGIVVWVVMLSSTLFFARETTQTNTFVITGFIIFILGFLLETIADHQKFVFKNNPKNKSTFITSGVWKYSRHPNYFGESLVWIGIFILSIDLSNPFSFLGIISPLFILIVLLFGTGVPILEKSYEKRFGKLKKYQEYKRKTNKFVFWFQKNN